MKRSIADWMAIIGILLTAHAAAAAPNLVLDGGFEEVRREPLYQSPYLEKSIKDGSANLAQGRGCDRARQFRPVLRRQDGDEGRRG